jgi:hypothetical protein
VAEKKPKAKAPPTKRRKPNGGATRTKAAIAKAAGPGRSYVYSEDLADRLCTLLAKGTGLRPSCKACGVDSATVLQWATDTKHPFSERFKNARTIGYLMMAEEILEISDNSTGDLTIDQNGHNVVNHENIQRSRLKVDTRKWIVSRMLPHIYGEKVTTQHVGPEGGPIKIDVESKMAVFLGKIDEIARRQAELKALEAEAEQESADERQGTNRHR